MDELTESQFHTVWTEAVGVEGYDKRMFQNLFQKMVENGTVIENGNKKGASLYIGLFFELISAIWWWANHKRVFFKFEGLDSKGYIKQFCFTPCIHWFKYDSTGDWVLSFVWLKWKFVISGINDY